MARLKLVEDKANGPAIISMLRDKIGGIVPYSPKGSKVARARAFQPDHEAGNLWLPHPSKYPWVEGYVDRFAAFPAGADDEIDAATQLLDHWAENVNDAVEVQSQAVSRSVLAALLG
jgi:predicted phage terminase large subunit-like protein